MKIKILKLSLSAVIGGFAMWVIGGLWHNLILPLISSNAQAHHEGLAVTLAAYILLALLMGYIFLVSYANEKSVLIKGIKVGVIIGIIWVFPHGLSMAATHGDSITHEFANGLYHIFEQGIGGIIIGAILGRLS